MPKLTFSTDELPPEVPDSARAVAWAEHYEKRLGRSGIEIMLNPDRPLQARIEVLPVGALMLASPARSTGWPAPDQASWPTAATRSCWF
jgi:hypothetical protein